MKDMRKGMMKSFDGNYQNYIQIENVKAGIGSSRSIKPMCQLRYHPIHQKTHSSSFYPSQHNKTASTGAAYSKPTPSMHPAKPRLVESYRQPVSSSTDGTENDKPSLNVPDALYSIKRNGIVQAYSAITSQGLFRYFLKIISCRKYNEDRVTIIINLQMPPTRSCEYWPTASLFGIYDGHGGTACADFLRDRLHLLVRYLINHCR